MSCNIDIIRFFFLITEDYIESSTIGINPPQKNILQCSYLIKQSIGFTNNSQNQQEVPEYFAKIRCQQIRLITSTTSKIVNDFWEKLYHFTSFKLYKSLCAKSITMPQWPTWVGLVVLAWNLGVCSFSRSQVRFFFISIWGG